MNMNFMIDALNPGRVGVPDSCSDVDFETPPQTTEFFETKTQSLLRFIRVAECLLHDWSVLCLAEMGLLWYPAQFPWVHSSPARWPFKCKVGFFCGET